MKSTWVRCVVGLAVVALAVGAAADDVRSVATDPVTSVDHQPSKPLVSEAVSDPAVWTAGEITSQESPGGKALDALNVSDAAVVLPDGDSSLSDPAFGVGCGPECEECWIGGPFENDCFPSWEDDGICDCGCQFPDTLDCGGGSGCGPECDWCHIGTSDENNCPTNWQQDGQCDCGCQFSDFVDCSGGGGGTPDLIVSSSGLSPLSGLNPGEFVNILATVRNQGTASAGSAFRIGWYISLDSNVSTGDAPWAVIVVDCCLGIGVSVDRNGSLAWPTVAPFNTPGATYFAALKVDDLGDVGESNESNNWGQVFRITLAADTGGDQYEPDDTPAQATQVSCGTLQSHTLDVGGDVDWFSVALQAGDVLTVATSNLTGTNPDTVIELFDDGCGVLTFNDDVVEDDLSSRMEWVAEYSGLHYVKVRTWEGLNGFCNGSGGGGGSCNYDISLTCGFCCEPSLSAGDRVRLLIDSPDSAVNLNSGHCGTVVCCDSDDQFVPMLISWDHWSDGHNENAFCPPGPISYPDSSGWWLGCSGVALDDTCGPCPPPDAAIDPFPADGARGVPVDVELCWNGGDSPEKLIYGQDDRLDVYEVSDPDLLAAADATVSLVGVTQLTNNGNGTYSLRGDFSYADWSLSTFGVPLCPGEPYATQPLEAFCSGTLVGPDLILTAGHCVLDAFECSQTAFVFGFEMADASTPVLTYPASDVYFCQSIVGRDQNAAGSDWGVIKLDRPVTGHDPLSVRRTGTVPLGNPLTMIGHPIGLPTKIAGGATVRDNSEAAFFQANVDAYGGNSGSAVLDTTSLTIEGVLVRGNDDFVQGSCLESNVCSDAGCPGWEDVTRATEFQHLIPAGQDVGYMVYFEDCDRLSFAWTGAADGTCITPPPMEPGTEYCWHVVARSSCGEMVGPTWRFTTEGDLSVVSTNPPNCAIDARQASNPDGSDPAGWNTIEVTFDGDAGLVALGDFAVSTPGLPFPPTVLGLAHILPANTVRLLLSRRISLMRWTCLTYVPTGQQTCFGHLPGDVQNDGASTASDILSVIDNLNGQVNPPHEDWQCDIDRSGQCGAGDILRVIDLLNGADQYDVWLGRTLDACPTAP